MCFFPTNLLFLRGLQETISALRVIGITVVLCNAHELSGKVVATSIYTVGTGIIFHDAGDRNAEIGRNGMFYGLGSYLGLVLLSELCHSVADSSGYCVFKYASHSSSLLYTR